MFELRPKEINPNSPRSRQNRRAGDSHKFQMIWAIFVAIALGVFALRQVQSSSSGHFSIDRKVASDQAVVNSGNNLE